MKSNWHPRLSTCKVTEAAFCRWTEWWTWAPSSNSLPGIALPKPGRKAHTPRHAYNTLRSFRNGFGYRMVSGCPTHERSWWYFGMFPAPWSIHEETDCQIDWSLVHKRSYSYNTTQILPWNQSTIIRKCQKDTGVWYSIFMYNQLQYGYRLHSIAVKYLKTHHPCNLVGFWQAPGTLFLLAALVHLTRHQACFCSCPTWIPVAMS